MPDIFVPIDTTRLSDYFLSLRSAGVFNTFALSWADAHRHDTNYRDFEAFQRNYDSAAVMKAFGEMAESKKISRSDVRGDWVASWMNEQARKSVSDTAHRIHADTYQDYLSKLMEDPYFIEQLKEKAMAEDRRSALINSHSDIYMGYMVKALIARNLFGIEYYYRIMRDQDTGLQEAIRTVKAIKD